MCHHDDGDIIIPRMTPDTWMMLEGGDHSPEGFWEHPDGQIWLTLEKDSDGPVWGFKVVPPGEEPDDGPTPYTMPTDHWDRIHHANLDGGANWIVHHTDNGPEMFRIVAVKMGHECWAHCDKVP